MSVLSIKNDKIPLWKGAEGSVSVDVPIPIEPLPVTADAIGHAGFSAAGKVAIGTNVSVGVSASSFFTLSALFREQTGADPDIVNEFELAPELRADNVMVAMDLGGKADVSAAGSFKYTALSAGATLDAGADARLVHTRSYARPTPAAEVLCDFFTNLALPGTVADPPPAGQFTSLEFGGYLNFGVNASAGYKMMGTHDFQSVAGLKLSEHYGLSIAGNLAVTANLAGRFGVEVRASDFSPAWVRVTVKRKRSSDLKIAADLSVGATIDTRGLPKTGKEFLGALLGVEAKNWLNFADNLVRKAAAIHTPADLAKQLDELSAVYILKFAGKAVDDLLPEEITDLLAKFKDVVDRYNNLGNAAVTLFDRYFDVAKTDLLSTLNTVVKLTSLASLQGDIPPLLWNVLQQLTRGKLLDAMVAESNVLAQIQTDATNAIELIEDDANTEIRDFIGLAKKEFGLDGLITEIARIDSPGKLTTELGKAARGLVTRIVGKAVDRIDTKDFASLTAFIQGIAHDESEFFGKFDQYLADAASQAFSAEFTFAYERAEENAALIDVDLRLVNEDGTPSGPGRALMRSAGSGDFANILAEYNPALVRLRSGLLTHNLSTTSGITVNVAGWHHDFLYSDMYKVVTKSDQQIRSTPLGMLNVFTTVELNATHNRGHKTDMHEQQMHSNFILRFLAETNTTITDSKFDAHDRAYVLDVVTGQSAVFSTSLSDSKTTPDKLGHLLDFAQQLGLDKKGATLAALQPILHLEKGNYGPVNAAYVVQFSALGLTRLFKSGNDIGEDDIRPILRRIVLANYAGNSGLLPVAYYYCSDRVRELAMGEGGFVSSAGILDEALRNGEVKLSIPLRNMLPDGALPNTSPIRAFVSTLFHIEKKLIDAFLMLQELMRQASIELADLEKASNAFGSALESFEGQSGLSDTMSSPAFAVFDGLIQLATPASRARDSALALTIGAGLKPRELLFQLKSEEAAAGA